MNKPELIIFDLGRVLLDFDFRKVVTHLKRYSPLPEKQIYHYFARTPLWDAFERGTIEPHDFFLALKKDLRLKNLAFAQFKSIWNNIFTEKPDTVSILRRLRKRYPIALLSNVNILHWDYIVRKYDFMEWFDHPIASCAVGFRKPEAGIYRVTLQAAGVRPSRAVFIDDVKEHVLGAKAVGIRAFQFIDARKLIRDLDGILQ